MKNWTSKFSVQKGHLSAVNFSEFFKIGIKMVSKEFELETSKPTGRLEDALGIEKMGIFEILEFSADISKTYSTFGAHH